MLHSLVRFSASDVAQQRMKIIKFYEKHGEKAAKKAFGADRKVISRWRNMKDFYERFKIVYPCTIKS